MSDRTLENRTRMYVDGIRTRVGNPRHPHHELYLESGIEAVYDTMFKAPIEINDDLPEDPYAGIESTIVLVVATISSLILLGMALL